MHVKFVRPENWLTLSVFGRFYQIVRSLQDVKTKRSQEHKGKHDIPRVSTKLAKDGTSVFSCNIIMQKTWFFHNRSSQEVGTNTPVVVCHICHPLVNMLARILQFPLTKAGETNHMKCQDGLQTFRR